MQYDVESLKQIPIQDVVIALSGTYPKDREPSMKQYNMHCCNGTFHKEGDKKPSLTIWKDINDLLINNNLSKVLDISKIKRSS